MTLRVQKISTFVKSVVTHAWPWYWSRMLQWNIAAEHRREINEGIRLSLNLIKRKILKIFCNTVGILITLKYLFSNNTKRAKYSMDMHIVKFSPNITTGNILRI